MKIRNRNLYASIIFILIFIIGFASDVVALNYTFGFTTDEELVWKCNFCDINKMNNIFGENWSSTGLFENLSQGKRMRWQGYVTKINDTSLSRTFNISVWKNEGSYDYSAEFSYLKDPSKYNLSIALPFVPFWLPVPVGNYLGELNLSSIYDVDNRVLPTINVQISRGFLEPSLPSEKVYIIAIYNSDGILSSFKLYTIENVVVIDIIFEPLPIYVVPLTIGLICAFFIAIILYVKKQRNKLS
jgi:hypothetical protein